MIETRTNLSTTTQPVHDSREMPTWRLILLMLAASLGYFVVQLDVSIVNLSLPTIQTYYHANVATLQWIVNAYTLSLSILLLSAGVLGDRYGSKRFLIIGYALFFAGSLACSVAPTISFILAARLFQGIGAAFIVPNSLAVINWSFQKDNRRRLLLISIWMSFGGVALTCGPILGGLITSFASWRYIFLINLPVCLFGIMLTTQWVKATPSRKSKRHDWLGQALILFSSTALLLLITNYVDMSPHMHVALIIAAAIGLGLFVIVELKLVDPAIPLDIFRNLGFFRAITYGAIVNFLYFGIVFYSSLYFRYDLKMTAIQAGLAFIPITLPLIFSNILSAKISRIHGPDRSITIGFMFMITGMLCLAFQDLYGGYIQMLPAFILVSFGVGLVTPMITVIALHSIGPERGGMITAVVNFFRQISGAFGVAVFGIFMASANKAISYRDFSLTLVILACILV
ncbi:MAG: MFS transporter, partial [Clostridia bacterium]|nr:MFS transporter [Clostridia bacterium]